MSASSGGREIFRDKRASSKELARFRGLLEETVLEDEEQEPCPAQDGKDVGRKVERNVSFKDMTPPEASSFSLSKTEDKKIRRSVYREKSDHLRELVHFRGLIKGAARYSLSKSQAKSIRRTEREKSARFRELVFFRGLFRSEAVNEEKESQPSQSSGAEKDVGRNVEGNVSFKDLTPPEASSFSPSKTEDKKIRRPVYREKSDRFRELVHFRGLIKRAARYSLSKSQVKSIRRTEREKSARFRELVFFRGLLRSEAVNEEKESQPSQSSGAENVKHVGEYVSVRRKNIVSFNQLGQLRGLTVVATEKKKEVRSSAVASFDLHETISTNTSVDGESRTANNSSDLKSSEDVKDKEEKEYGKQTTVEPKGGNEAETLEPSKTEGNEEQKSRIMPKPEKELEKERKGTVQDKLKFVRETTYEQGNTDTVTESKGSVSQRRGHNIYIKPSKLTAVLDQARTSKCITYIDDRSLTKNVDDSSQRKHNKNEPSICDIKLVSSGEENTQAQSSQLSIPIKEEKEMYLVQLKPEEESKEERKRIFQERLKFARETTQQDNVCIKPKELEVFSQEDEIQADQETEVIDSQRKVSKCVIKPSKLTEKLEQRGKAKVLTNAVDNISVSDTTEDCTQRNQSGSECVQKQSIQVSIPIRDVKENNEKSQTNEEIQSVDADICVLRDNKDVPVTVTVTSTANTQERTTNVSSKDRTREMETVSTEIVQEKLAVRPSTNAASGTEESIKKNSRIARDSSKVDNKSVKNCQKYQTQEQICATDLRSQIRTVKKEKEKLLVNVTFSDYESERNKLRKTRKSSKEATYNQRISNRYVEKKNNTRKSKSKKQESVDVGCQTIEQEAIDLHTSKAPAAQNKGKIKKENGSKTKPRENCKGKTEKNDVQAGITTETSQRSQLSINDVRETGITTKTRYPEQLPINDTQVTGIPSEARQTDQLTADDTQVTGISTETRQTDQLSADNTQLTGISTEETQADQFSTEGTQVAGISTEERHTDQLSIDTTQLTGISTEAKQNDELSTDDTQLTGISTEETQADQFSIDGTQLTGISTEERQADLLSTDNTQLTDISTEAGQTDQLSTDTTQLTSISTEARQTDELSTDDTQLTGISTEETQADQFSTDGTQLTGISTEERQTDLFSTDNTQVTGISTEARQTDQLPTDSTQLTGIFAEARQTDQLPTDDTQVKTISTEEIQTDQLSTDTTQVTSTFTDIRQSDQLSMESQEINTNNDSANCEDAKEEHGLYNCAMVHPENKDPPDAHSEGKTRSYMTKTAARLLKNFTDRINMDCTRESTNSNNQASHQMANRMQTDQLSTDNTQVTSISADKVQTDQISTDNMQVTSISTEARQTDQRSMESQEMEINTNIDLANSEDGKEEHGLYSCAKVHPEDKVPLEPHSEDGIEMGGCTRENNQASQHQMKTNLIYNETLVRRRRALDPRTRVDLRISTKTNNSGCVDYAAAEFKDHMKAIYEQRSGVSKRLEGDARSKKTGFSQRRQREISYSRELQWPYYSRYTHRPMYKYPVDKYGHIGYPTYPLQPVQRQTTHATCRYAPYYVSGSERKMQSEITYPRPEYSKNWTVPKPDLEEILWCAGIVSAIFLTTWIVL